MHILQPEAILRHLRTTLQLCPLWQSLFTDVPLGDLLFLSRAVALDGKADVMHGEFDTLDGNTGAITHVAFHSAPQSAGPAVRDLLSTLGYDTPISGFAPVPIVLSDDPEQL